MKPGEIDSDKTNDRVQELWGELTGIDDRTDQESDTGCERLVGPDQGLSKTRIFQEVMYQFRVHAVRPKPSFYPLSD